MAYSVGLLPDQFWRMTLAEVYAVIMARRPVAPMTEPTEIEEEERPPQSAEEMAVFLNMLNASMGGKVVKR